MSDPGLFLPDTTLPAPGSELPGPQDGERRHAWWHFKKILKHTFCAANSRNETCSHDCRLLFTVQQSLKTYGKVYEARETVASTDEAAYAPAVPATVRRVRTLCTLLHACVFPVECVYCTEPKAACRQCKNQREVRKTRGSARTGYWKFSGCRW